VRNLEALSPFRWSEFTILPIESAEMTNIRLILAPLCSARQFRSEESLLPLRPITYCAQLVHYDMVFITGSKPPFISTRTCLDGRSGQSLRLPAKQRHPSHQIKDYHRASRPKQGSNSSTIAQDTTFLCTAHIF
jgi:hypothetical protein